MSTSSSALNQESGSKKSSSNHRFWVMILLFIVLVVLIVGLTTALTIVTVKYARSKSPQLSRRKSASLLQGDIPNNNKSFTGNYLPTMDDNNIETKALKKISKDIDEVNNKDHYKRKQQAISAIRYGLKKSQDSNRAKKEALLSAKRYSGYLKDDDSVNNNYINNRVKKNFFLASKRYHKNYKSDIKKNFNMQNVNRKEKKEVMDAKHNFRSNDPGYSTYSDNKRRNIFAKHIHELRGSVTENRKKKEEVMHAKRYDHKNISDKPEYISNREEKKEFISTKHIEKFSKQHTNEPKLLATLDQHNYNRSVKANRAQKEFILSIKRFYKHQDKVYSTSNDGDVMSWSKPTPYKLNVLNNKGLNDAVDLDLFSYSSGDGKIAIEEKHFGLINEKHCSAVEKNRAGICVPREKFFYEVNQTNTLKLLDFKFNESDSLAALIWQLPLNQQIYSFIDSSNITVVYNDELAKHVLKVSTRYISNNNVKPKELLEHYDSKISQILGFKDDTMTYMWWFKINEELHANDNFFHIFQLKSINDITERPLITFTIKRENNGHRYFSFIELNKMYVLGLIEKFKYKWVQAYVEINFSNSGYLKFDFRDIYDKQIFTFNDKQEMYYDQFAYSLAIPEEFVRPSWGVYESFNEQQMTKDSVNISYSSIEVYKRTEASLTENSLNIMMNQNFSCSMCHVHAKCVDNAKCICKYNLIGDGISECSCPKDQKMSNLRCYDLDFFNYELDSSIYYQSIRTEFPEGSNPYQILSKYPFKTKENFWKDYNNHHLSIIYDDDLQKPVLKMTVNHSLNSYIQPYNQEFSIKILSTANNDTTILAAEGDTMIYLFWFKVSRLTHLSQNIFDIFQIVATQEDTGQDDLPIFAFSLNQFNGENHLFYRRFDSMYDLGPLNNYHDAWVQAYVEIKYEKDGYIKFDLKDMEGNRLLELVDDLSFVDNHVNCWEDNYRSIRPRWGIYKIQSRERKFDELEEVYYTDLTVYKKFRDDSPLLPEDCRVSDWFHGPCEFKCGRGTVKGFRNVTRTIIRPASRGGEPCPDLLKRTEECEGRCLTIDCEVTEWVTGSCKAHCGTGTVNGTVVSERTITTYPSNDGALCPELTKKEACVHRCPELAILSEKKDCSKCHSLASCETSGCQCVNNLIGDGVKFCGCNETSKLKEDHCVTLFTFNYDISTTDFKQGIHATFPKASNPYKVLYKYPWNNEVEEHPGHVYDHLQVVWDPQIRKQVLNVIMHRDLDGDGSGDLKDRQRTEFKASEKSAERIIALKDETMVYMWWFKINGNVKASKNFFHIFQLKVVGDVDGTPMFTLTIEQKSNADKFYYTDFGNFHELGPMSAFSGKWIQAYVEVKYSSSNGYTKFNLKDIMGKNLIDTKGEEFYTIKRQNRWIKGSKLVRTKWGIYRSKITKKLYNSEDVLAVTDLTIYKKR